MTPDSLRVGFVIDDLGHGGAQRQLLLLARALYPRYLAHVYVLSAIEEPYARALRAHGIPFTTSVRRTGLDIARLRWLTRSLAADRIDIVHAFLDASNTYAFLAARRLRRPVLLSLQSDRLRLHGLRARALRWMLQRADAVVVNSDAGRAFLRDRSGVAPARVHVVRNIVVPPSVRAHAGGGPLVGGVGRLVASKRFDLAVRAMPAVRARVPDARLELVGDGPERAALRVLSASLGLDDAVSFPGAVDDAVERIAHMSCLVLPSSFEGIPNVVLEAMSLGVPVVTSAAGDLAALVVDGSTGAVVSESSVAALADAVVRALTDATLRARAREEGPRLIRERFAPEVALGVLIPLYESLGKQTGAAAREATTPVLGE